MSNQVVIVLPNVPATCELFLPLNVAYYGKSLYGNVWINGQAIGQGAEVADAIACMNRQESVSMINPAAVLNGSDEAFGGFLQGMNEMASEHAVIVAQQITAIAEREDGLFRRLIDHIENRFADQQETLHLIGVGVKDAVDRTALVQDRLNGMEEAIVSAQKKEMKGLDAAQSTMSKKLEVVAGDVTAMKEQVNSLVNHFLVDGGKNAEGGSQDGKSQETNAARKGKEFFERETNRPNITMFSGMVPSVRDVEEPEYMSDFRMAELKRKGSAEAQRERLNYFLYSFYLFPFFVLVRSFMVIWLVLRFLLIY